MEERADLLRGSCGNHCAVRGGDGDPGAGGGEGVGEDVASLLGADEEETGAGPDVREQRPSEGFGDGRWRDESGSEADGPERTGGCGADGGEAEGRG